MCVCVFCECTVLVCWICCDLVICDKSLDTILMHEASRRIRVCIRVCIPSTLFMFVRILSIFCMIVCILSIFCMCVCIFCESVRYCVACWICCDILIPLQLLQQYAPEYAAICWYAMLCASQRHGWWYYDWCEALMGEALRPLIHEVLRWCEGLGQLMYACMRPLMHACMRYC